jgi:hypothetical protein
MINNSFQISFHMHLSVESTLLAQTNIPVRKITGNISWQYGNFPYTTNSKIKYKLGVIVPFQE